MLAGLKARLFPVFDVPRQHDRRCDRPFRPFLAYHAQARRHVCSCLPRKSSSTSRILGVVAGRFSVAGDNLSYRHGGRASAASRSRRARGETEAQARRGSARSSAAPAARVAPAPAAPVTPAEQLAARTTALNQGLNTIYAPTGTAPTTISHNTIEALPQGENATVEKIVLQFPGVTQDSAAGANFHVRNEHANVQIRINGIMLPDGVSGFGTFLDTALIGNITLITGALPPQFGLRTSGVLDIWTRSDAFNNIGTDRRLRRQQGDFHAKHRIRRHHRTDAILCHRPVLREQYRAGKSDTELERNT